MILNTKYYRKESRRRRNNKERKKRAEAKKMHKGQSLLKEYIKQLKKDYDKLNKQRTASAGSTNNNHSNDDIRGVHSRGTSKSK